MTNIKKIILLSSISLLTSCSSSNYPIINKTLILSEDDPSVVFNDEQYKEDDFYTLAESIFDEPISSSTIKNSVKAAFSGGTGSIKVSADKLNQGYLAYNLSDDSYIDAVMVPFNDKGLNDTKYYVTKRGVYSSNDDLLMLKSRSTMVNQYTKKGLVYAHSLEKNDEVFSLNVYISIYDSSLTSEEVTCNMTFTYNVK